MRPVFLTFDGGSRARSAFCAHGAQPRRSTAHCADARPNWASRSCPAWPPRGLDVDPAYALLHLADGRSLVSAPGDRLRRGPLPACATLARHPHRRVAVTATSGIVCTIAHERPPHRPRRRAFPACRAFRHPAPDGQRSSIVWPERTQDTERLDPRREPLIFEQRTRAAFRAEATAKLRVEGSPAPGHFGADALRP